MKHHYWKIIILLTLPLLMSLQEVASFSNNTSERLPVQFKTKYHVILVLDGPRWSETWGDSTHHLIPNLANTLKKEGTFFENFRNNGRTYTNSGHTALITGVYQRISNLGKQLPKNPNIFQYYLKQANVDKRKAWIMTSKGKLEMLANTKNKHWWNTYMPSTYCGTNGLGKGYPNDRDMVPTFKEILIEHKPTISIINLLDMDAWAHQGNWDRYISAIKELDQLTLDIWTTIQNDPEMKDQTAIYITNDHGRHLDGVKNGFESHGCRCEGCRHISLLAIGPDFKKNTVVTEPYEMIDIPATISYMLNVPMPTARGKVINHLFQ